MSSILAPCDDCGDVKLTAEQLTVVTNVDSWYASYVFRCPKCRLLTSLPVWDVRTVDVLVRGGARTATWSLSDEVNDPDRHTTAPAFVPDDLLDFHELLARAATIPEWHREMRDST